MRQHHLAACCDKSKFVFKRALVSKRMDLKNGINNQEKSCGSLRSQKEQWHRPGSWLLLGKEIGGVAAGVAIIVGDMKVLLKLRVSEEHKVGGIDQHIHCESYCSPVKQYPGAKILRCFGVH